MLLNVTASQNLTGDILHFSNISVESIDDLKARYTAGGLVVLEYQILDNNPLTPEQKAVPMPVSTCGAGLDCGPAPVHTSTNLAPNTGAGATTAAAAGGTVSVVAGSFDWSLWARTHWVLLALILVMVAVLRDDDIRGL